MKVVSAKEMARIEGLAYKAGASEEAFMDRAGAQVAKIVIDFCERNHKPKKALLICGKGNNAGDGFVCGKTLLDRGFIVIAYHFAPQSQCSPLCQKKAKEFSEKGGKIQECSKNTNLDWKDFSVIVDGLFGTGFKGEVDDLYRKVIEGANQSKIPIISIDIPSGINGNTGEMGGIAIKATETVFLGLPKVGCLIGDAWNYVGNYHIENFGLKDEFISQANAEFILIEDSLAAPLIPEIQKNRHKYQSGYVVGIGGSPGMPGAAMLSSYASLRAGAGIVRLLHPQEMSAELAGAPYELVRQGYDFNHPEKILDSLNKASAIFIGPGIGKQGPMIKLLKDIFPKIQKKCVIDADALNIIAENDLKFPQETVITPHHGEMQKLLHKEKQEITSQMDFIRQSREYAKKNRVTLVLKGSPTFIFNQDETPHINLRGNPGMATAGTGDVLTGIISALIAQKMETKEAAILGVYLHALAGEFAAAEKTAYSMVASDLIEMLPQVFKHFQKLI